ncbi:MAG: hypothetical protein GF331_21030 [Chitinivibrionales bacterium]|nr:hypothetical protein [Chitinivibrionales bacterium]
MGLKAENSSTGLTTRTRFGGHFTGSGPNDGNQLTIGLFGYATKGGMSTNCWAGYFSGNVYATGTYHASDEQIKRNIAPIASPLEKVLQLQPKQYEYDRENYPHLGLGEGLKLGLVAQDVEKVLPNAVTNVAVPEEAQQDGLTSIVEATVHLV